VHNLILVAGKYIGVYYWMSCCSENNNHANGTSTHVVNNTRTIFVKCVSDSDTASDKNLDDSNHSFLSRVSANEVPPPPTPAAPKRPIDVRPILEKLNIDVDRLVLIKRLFPNKRHNVPFEPVVINMNELNYKMCGERLVIIDQMIESLYRHGKSAQVDASVNRLRNERLKVEEEMRDLVIQMNKSSNISDNASHKPGGGSGIGGGGGRSSSRRDKPKSSHKATRTSKDGLTTPAGNGPTSANITRPDSSMEEDNIGIKRPRSSITTEQEIEVADILVSLMS